MEAGPKELYCSIAACDLNFQNGKYSNKTKYSFLSTCIIIVLLEDSVHKKYFILSVKLNQALGLKNYKQVFHLWCMSTRVFESHG